VAEGRVRGAGLRYRHPVTTTLPVAWLLAVTSALASCVAAIFLGIALDSFIPLAIPLSTAVAMTWFVRKFVLGTPAAKRVLIACSWLLALALPATIALLGLLLGGITC